ncbi:hydroxymethylbilane synthase [bacterium]|nr:hydroxymethylbilane synthase [bacterium]
MSKKTLKLGTRGSRLALTQANLVAEQIRNGRPDIQVETIIIETTGDKILDSSLARIGGKGLFTKEIERALLDGRVDVAVHSLKDLPTLQPEGLALGAISRREPPGDLLIAAKPVDWKKLGPEETIGTSSLRRRAQVLALNPSVQIAELRGNVPTRIRKMLDGQYTAILLAAAGVKRLGEQAPFMSEVPFDEMLPAPGQGAIGLQVREGDDETCEILSSIHHEETAACVTAERALLQALGGGCQIPLGSLAEINGDGTMSLRGRVISQDGTRSCEGEVSGTPADAEQLGEELAEKLKADGAVEILAEVEQLDAEAGYENAVRRAEAMRALPLGDKTIIVTRDEDTDGPLSTALRDLGAHPLCLPLVQHLPPEDPAPLHEGLLALDEFDWLVLTSPRGVATVEAELEKEGRSLSAVKTRIACVGKGTARAVADAGAEVALIAQDARAEGLLEAFLSEQDLKGAKVLYPRADRARSTLVEGLRELGAEVSDPIAYRTVPAKQTGPVVEALDTRRAQGILFCSASAVESLSELLDREEFARLLGGVAVGSMGPVTSQAIERAGAGVDVEPEERTFSGLAHALAEHFARGSG